MTFARVVGGSYSCPKEWDVSLVDVDAHRTNTTQWYRWEEEEGEEVEEQSERRRDGLQREWDGFRSCGKRLGGFRKSRSPR